MRSIHVGDGRIPSLWCSRLRTRSHSAFHLSSRSRCCGLIKPWTCGCDASMIRLCAVELSPLGAGWIWLQRWLGRFCSSCVELDRTACPAGHDAGAWPGFVCAGVVRAGPLLQNRRGNATCGCDSRSSGHASGAWSGFVCVGVVRAGSVLQSWRRSAARSMPGATGLMALTRTPVRGCRRLMSSDLRL